MEKILKRCRQFIVGDFKQLLFFLLLLFVFRPYNIGPHYISIWNIFFSGVLLASIFNTQHKKKIRTFALILGIPALIFNWASLIHVQEWLFVTGMTSSLIFLIFSIFSLLKRVILGKVTSDTWRGIICVYLMIGFAFSILFTLSELKYPGSFYGLEEKPALYPHGHYHSEMVYFSFITLLAIGYGDITPGGDLGQMFVVLEGIIGQFYLAIIVARLVGIYAYRAKTLQE